MHEHVEVASLIGDVDVAERKVNLRSISVSRDGTAKAGHLAATHVGPTLEVIITESAAHLRKAKDAETGLALIRPAA